MALEALRKRKFIDLKNEELAEHRKAKEELQRREAELTQALDEAASDEDLNTIEEEMKKYDEDKEMYEAKETELTEAIATAEKELEEIERKVPEPKVPEKEKRGENKDMATRTKFFGMDMQERTAFFADEGIKNFLSEVRSCMREKRALNNVGLTIPDIALPIIRQVVEENSKLMKYVTVRSVSGTSRQNIMGDIPEAFWDEMCAPIKEMDLTFYNMEMDGYKVSGYFAVCNAELEDSDLNLATELFTAIGKAIAKAVDKAIVYGKGIKMPMGIVTSLMRTTAPDDYSKTGREWEDLTTTHVITGTASAGTDLFKEITVKSGIVDNDYDTTTLIWIMNRATKTKILAESIGVNSAGAIVAGMNSTMPVVGGDIVDLSFIPDDTIVFGYSRNYTLVERAGTKLGQSEHVRFIEDQTVFKGTARYDGDVAIREAFGIMGLGKAPVTTPPTFAGEEESGE